MLSYRTWRIRLMPDVSRAKEKAKEREETMEKGKRPGWTSVKYVLSLNH